MAYDDVITRNENEELAVRVVNSTEGSNSSTYDDIYTRDTNGKLAMRVVGAGGGGSVDYNRVIEKSATIPSATSSNVGKVYMYTGETNATYTHGYIYENQSVSEYEDTVTFVPATISGTVVSATSNSLATLTAEYITGDITSIVSGTMTYDSDGNLWVFVGKDSENTTVGTFQIYQEDYEDAGFTFTGTPENGDVVAFTCTITESTSYAWVRLDVQPAGGSGDQHNLGWYADLTALQTAHPTGSNGDFAILGSTDTVWVWDSGTSAWKDTDTKGQVTSVNGQTGDVTVQATLVSGTNIKTIDGNSVLGSGNLELSTYLTYPAGWTTNSTTKAFCDDIAADTTAVAGKAYLGEVTFSDLPASLGNGEVIVEIMDGTTAQNKVIVLTLTSGNNAPYMWKYTYWNGGSNVSGWQTWATAAQGAKADTAVQPADLATVATTGAYSDLSGTPTIPAAIQVSALPTASADELGKIYQYTGTTDANYTNGYFYKCVSDGQDPATYSWSNIQVQAGGGGSSYTAGTGIDITSGVISVTAPTLKNIATGSGGTGIGDNCQCSGNYTVAVGYYAKANSPSATALGQGAEAGSRAVAVGETAKATAAGSIAIGKVATASATCSLQINMSSAGTPRTNSDANTVKIANDNGNYEMMSADGTIPAARHASLPSADGTYVLKLVISGGVPTLSWVAE